MGDETVLFSIAPELENMAQKHEFVLHVNVASTKANSNKAR